jgi:hypothetical protein
VNLLDLNHKTGKKVFLISLYLWHDIKKCSSVSTSVQNLQNRSSLGILRLLYLPRSIFKQ